MKNLPVASIHLDAIQHNLEFARELAPKSKIMAIVKADAYGHGAVQVSRTLRNVSALGVARVEEGVLLRDAGIETQIIVLEGPIDDAELDACRINRLTPVLHSNYQVERLKSSKHADMGVWLKVDTGMHRLGFSAEEFRLGMTTGKALNIVGVMSHLANADDPGEQENSDQISIFDDLTRDVDCELSIAGSGAIINYANSHFDWIRPGIMLYGGSPTGRTDSRLKGAMTLEAPIVSINEIHAGESIGYGGIWKPKTDTRVAVVGIGYADGYPRETPEGTPVVIGGVRRPIVGRISMDMTFVELEPGDVVNPGDLAQLWGPDLPIDEVAASIGTISYTLVSGLTGRVVRRFDGGAA
jgi:alanine racemase